MATIKKPAKPQAAAKKTAVKKPAAKKPAAKKPAAKKAVAKKPAVKKAAAKKPAVKKAAVKKPAAKKPAVKKAVAKKPAAKKPAAKAPANKPPQVQKPVEKTIAVKKPAPVKVPPPVKEEKPAPEQPGEALDPNVKYRNLFDAFTQGKLPFANGYIVSTFFSETSAYSIYEVVSYAGVKEIFPTDTGLQFTTGGKKLYILVEPDTYQSKFQEPVSRSRTQGEYIPKRFNELEIIIAKNQTKIMIAKEPDETFGSFTILKPQGQNFAVVFYQLPNMYESLAVFFEESFNRQRKIPQADAKKAARRIAEIVEKYMGFKGQFE